MNLHENIQRIKEMMGLLTEDENEPAVKGDSNPLKLPYIDTWHNGQYKAENDETEEAIKLMTKAAEEAEKYAKENNDGGVAGEARYYRGTIACFRTSLFCLSLKANFLLIFLLLEYVLFELFITSIISTVVGTPKLFRFLVRGAKLEPRLHFVSNPAPILRPTLVANGRQVSGN